MYFSWLHQGNISKEILNARPKDDINLQNVSISSKNADASKERNTERKQLEAMIPLIAQKWVPAIQKKVSKRSQKSRYSKFKQRKTEIRKNPLHSATYSPYPGLSSPNVPFRGIMSNKNDFNPSLPQDVPGKCHICLYRNSIENWQPLDGQIYCPKCQTSESPVIRSPTIKAGKRYSSLGANCMRNCWSVCFKPFSFSKGSKYFLHCAECFYLLGMYDEREKCFQLNEEFKEYGGCLFTEERRNLLSRIKWKNLSIRPVM